MKTDLLNVANKVIILADAMVSNTASSFRLRKEASECYISLALLHDYFDLDPVSKIQLEFLLNRIQNKICYEEYFGYYMGFYYLPQHVFDKNVEALSKGIYQSNVNVSCFRCKIHASGLLGFTLDSSADAYFFTRGDKVITAISNYMRYPFEFDASAILYFVLNYYQALVEYSNCPDDAYEAGANALIINLEFLFSSILKYPPFQDELSSNQQLLAFWNSLVPNKYKLPTGIADFPLVLSNKYRWILYSLYSIDPPAADNILNACYDRIVQAQNEDILQNALIMRILCQAHLYRKDMDLADKELYGFSCCAQDGVGLGLDYFFSHYDGIRTQSCTHDEIELLYSFDDHTLREKVVACMKNVDPNELDRQVKKPHGAQEISDLDIRFSEAGKTKYLCLPFKTGREITKASVDESYMYQLLKPFSHFGSLCMVVFVTAKRCSQGLETYIERIAVRQPSWRIEVLQEEQLCKLLKANGQI